MPGIASITPDDRPWSKIRKSLWRWWAITVALITWYLWCAAPEFHQKSVFIPIGITALGVLAGWAFGYKLGIAPLFVGFYIRSNKKGD